MRDGEENPLYDEIRQFTNEKLVPLATEGVSDDERPIIAGAIVNLTELLLDGFENLHRIAVASEAQFD